MKFTGVNVTCTNHVIGLLLCSGCLVPLIIIILGCSYCASSVRIAIRLPTDATVYFVLYLFPLFLPYMFRALISPSSGVSQAVFYIQPFGSCGVYVAHLRVPVDGFVVVVSLYQSTGTRR